jgi:quinol monooxygenase YgiN
LARRTAGCLEFAVVADPLEPERIVILERWESRAPMVAFRQDGPSSEQQAAIIGGHVAEYEVSAETVVLGSGR